MIETGFESRVKIQDIIDSQLPEFILDENPKTAEFLKQYYISQEFQGGSVDIVENLDQYLKLDNLKPEVVNDTATLSASIDADDTTINVSSTKGFPNSYGLLKIDDEIITYTGSTTTSFTGCIRGFSGISKYHQDLDQEELLFSQTSADSHSASTKIENLSTLFLKEFFAKLKYSFAPGFEGRDFNEKVDVGNFLKFARSFYSSKGTKDSFRILFNVLYGEDSQVINLEEYLLKPSDADYVRRQAAIAEIFSGDPTRLVGQTIYKTGDPNTNASVASVETFTRKGVQYFRVGFFIGYENSAINGILTVTPSTKSIDKVSVGSSVITVDSTIGFTDSGTLKIGNNSVTYTDKSVNQFLGCSGVVETIEKTENVYSSDEIYYGYEDGDLSKKIEFRLTGVLSDFVQQSDSVIAKEGQILTVRSIGDRISNPESNKTYKEVIANSWIYNTSSTIDIESINGSSVILKSFVDRSQLKVGDEVEILEFGSNIVVYPTDTTDIPFVESATSTSKEISLSNFNFHAQSNRTYSIRRKLKKANSLYVPFQYGNSTFVSDVQNTYVDDENLYVASNSLPSYTGNTNFFDYQITANIKTATLNSNEGDLIDQSPETGNYTAITFDRDVPFVSGDEIYYSPSDGSSNLLGLESGTYFVKVLSNPKSIKLFSALTFIDNESDALEFNYPETGIGEQIFVLNSQKSSIINPNNILRKFPLSPPNLENGTNEETVPGSVGILANGVEIYNYKTLDKLYYGPLENLKVLFGGSDYDIINPPNIKPSISSGLGTNALIQPVISGTIKNIFVDDQDFDVDSGSVVKVVGGNITGGNFDPVIVKRRREILFDARSTDEGGGIDVTTNQLTFVKDHNLTNGQEVIYRNNGNPSVTIGIGQSSLVDSSTYYAKVDNNSTIQLFESFDDYLNNSNAIEFDDTTLVGTHKILTGELKNTISKINIIDGGKVTNRTLLVKSAGISTVDNTINFENHGFSKGEIVEYDAVVGLGTTIPQKITGLTTTNQYYVLPVSNDSFRLCNAGIGGTIITNFEQENYVLFNSVGTGFQQFKYPKIEVVVEYSSSGGTTTQVKKLVTTPVAKGEIVDAYLYEPGTKYGSTIKNFERKPAFELKTGKNAQVKPIIVNGSVVNANLQFGGFDYFSVPELKVVDPTGSGSGAEIRATISEGKVNSVTVVNAGIGYSDTTRVDVISSGTGALFEVDVRSLDLNETSLSSSDDYQILVDSEKGLSHYSTGYSDTIRNAFQDVPGSSSKIIGWAYDGNPIYGPFGISDPKNVNSGIKTLTSGYSVSVSNIEDRPSLQEYPLGSFVEDYVFDNSGDLDVHNGRFEINADFPNGVYAYHAVVDSLTNEPVFPYFIGKTYRSNFIKENATLNQKFDFNNSNLFRNTFPYKVLDENAGNDFLTESNEITRQRIKIESISKGSINGFDIINPGQDYKVGDRLEFDNSDIDISPNEAQANVSVIKGKSVNKVETTKDTYSDVIFVWNNDKIIAHIGAGHTLNDKTSINISGFSTNILSSLNGYHEISVTNIPSVGITTTIGATGAACTEIYVTNIPSTVSVGNSITIGSETLKILNIFPKKNIFRVERGDSNLSHQIGVAVTFNTHEFEINKKLDYFESNLNKKLYFNPHETVGFGTTAGISYEASFSFGNQELIRSIQVQRIHLEDHGLGFNQPITFNTSGASTLSISTSPTGTPFDIPTQLFAVPKSKNTIGIKTALNSDEIFFRNIGDNIDNYYFETDFEQKLGEIEFIRGTVSVSTSHGLTAGDLIELNIQPNLSVGIGTSTAVRLSRNSFTGNIEINKIQFGSGAININADEIQYVSHGFETGNKVYYDANTVSAGLETGSYYVYKVTSDKFKLCKTYKNSIQNPPITVDITGAGGGSQTISLINPQISVIKNNNLVFDTSDSSLSGYNLKLFYDQDFVNEFISTGSTSSFSLSNSTGVSTVNYSSNIPDRLFYTLEKSGGISTSDRDVKNYSQIFFTDSAYNNSYIISGIGTTTFEIGLNGDPEKNFYDSTECDTIEYSTTSTSAKGPVSKINLINSGFGYKRVPEIIDSNSVEGENLYTVSTSNNIGNIEKVRILNQGFEYSSDRTLTPKAFISPKITLEDSNAIGIVTVTFGGRNYIRTPDLVVVDRLTREKVDSGLLSANLNGTAVVSVNVESAPKGISNESAEIFAVDNTNGVSIKRVLSGSTGIFTCVLTTPSLGFSTDPFTIGDQVFIEGIQKYSSDGDGFNSEDYGFKFFTVSNYKNKFTPGLVDDELTVNLAGLTTNTGIAKTIQDSTGNVVNKLDYPTFTVSLNKSFFTFGETLISDDIERDLIVLEYDEVSGIKVFGSYQLSVGEVIRGKTSGNIARIQNLINFEGFFKIDFATEQNVGWTRNTGKLNEDYQVIPDNNYYQNLSYSIKSSQTWKDIRTPVNSLVHISGLKNFSDTEVFSKPTEPAGLTTTSDQTSIVKNITTEKRVDTINNFDTVTDVDVVGSTSRFLKLNRKKLSNYSELGSAIGLKIDDISPQFSKAESDPQEFVNISRINLDQPYTNYLFKVNNLDGTQVQVTNLIVLNDKDSNSSFILDKSSLSNDGSSDLHTSFENEYGEFTIESDSYDESFLRFKPVDPFDTEYDIKIIEKRFDPGFNISTSTSSIGFIDITTNIREVITGETTTILGVSTNTTNSLYVNVHISQETDNKANFAELYVTHDGTDTNIAEYYFDTSEFNRSVNKIGNFSATIENGLLKLNYENGTSSDVIVRSKIVGFGTTSTAGISSTFRFRNFGQPIGNERSAIYEVGFTTTTAGLSTSILSLNKFNFNSAKSLVEVGVGTMKSVHQVLMIQDASDVYVKETQFITVGNETGIGTFGGQFEGSNQFELVFYPDNNITDDINISTLNECLYTTTDFANDPDDFIVGDYRDIIETSQYLAINGDRINKKNFVLRNNGVPIFAKKFDPSNTNVLNASTGTFTIDNHFFSENEELIYTPKSSFVGVGSTPMMYQNGNLIAALPSSVFVINKTDSSFGLSTTKAGTAVTFVSFGEGNIHQLEMAKKNEKSLITINNLVQYPLSFSKIQTSLSGNGGSISTAADTFTLSGISTIDPGNILKIEDEYVSVVNVGLGTTNVGPITNIGTEKLVVVERGAFGTIATDHSDSTTVDLYKGSINIVGDELFFAEPPRGSLNITRTDQNLEFETSDFSGRVFLRKNYDTNQIYDDISGEFTGIARTFTLTVGGGNTSGIGTTGGNGIMFINGIFQTPTTVNNPNKNFSIIEELSPSPGISTVVFSGIRTDIGDPTSVLAIESDVNQNQVPRGGIIVSLGSSGGSGYAPLAGASQTTIVGAGGSIVGFGTTGSFGSGYYGTNVSVAITDTIYDHRFIRSVTDSITDNNSNTYTATDASYNSYTGVLVLTIPNHGLTDSNTVGISNDGIVFSCSKDGYATEHAYPRAVSKTKQRRGETGGDPISGIQTDITAYTTNTISINVGSGGGAGNGANVTATIGVGGTLTFAVGAGGTEYVNPEMFVAEPSYENLSVTGISRIGVGATTDTGTGLLLDVVVGSSSTVGIGSTLFDVTEFSIARNGSGFRKGDVFTPVGLVTDANLSQPNSVFELTVLDTFTDSFSFWQFGELDYIDSIKNFQDGIRLRFPIFYNDNLLSFEKPNDSSIDMSEILLIVINGVIQTPGVNYNFDGGSSFTFVRAPRVEDDVNIFFYRGSRGEDDTLITNILQSIERGDDVQVVKNDSIPTTKTQDNRVAFDLTSSNKFETDSYDGVGIDEVNPRGLFWTKQKVDRMINGEFVNKTRSSIVSQIFPTAKVIGDMNSTDTAIFVDNVDLFKYNVSSPYTFGAIVLDNEVSIGAGATATVGPNGTITALTITNNGSGYNSGSTVDFKIAAPPTIGVGIGTTATATGTVNSNGEITSTTITNPGLGYTGTNPPLVIVAQPDANYEIFDRIDVVEGFSGIVTGIVPVTGVGHGKGFRFFLDRGSAFGNELQVGYPIYIKNTSIGSGVTSVDDSDSAVVSIGTSFLDNVYIVSGIDVSGNVGIVTCNVHTNTAGHAGISTSGNFCGEFSWGVFKSVTRSNTPVSIAVTGKTIDVGLSTFPTIQRRSEGLRGTGALVEKLD
jgi:hypothetical protein